MSPANSIMEPMTPAACHVKSMVTIMPWWCDSGSHWPHPSGGYRMNPTAKNHAPCSHTEKHRNRCTLYIEAVVVGS